VSYQALIAPAGNGGQAQQPRVVSKVAQQGGFGDRLRRLAADATDANQRDNPRSVRAIHLCSG
jgi:hypothetical protein